MALVEGDLRQQTDAKIAIAEGGLRAAAGIAARRGVERYRAAVTAGGLGSRLANTVRAAVYPAGAAKSMSPAAFIYTRAPKLIAAFDQAPTIRPVKGSQFLWIPTENTPKRSRKTMSPGAVEELYGDFEYVPSLTRPGIFLAVVPAVRAKTARGFRKASAKRVASGRDVLRVVMFVLVKFVSLRKRIDIAAVRRDLEFDWPNIVARSLSDAFAGDA